MKIIAGQFKNRKLLSPPGKSITRPITGAVKKSLFDSLGARLDGATIVDLYCGTGTMGLEAISRGAERCFFAERDRSVISRLKRNIEMLQVGDACKVWPGDLARRLGGRLAAIGGAIDIVFVDPPYADSRRWDWDRVGREIFKPLGENLSADGLVILRTPNKVELPQTLGGLDLTRSRKYGDMVVSFYCPRESETGKAE